MAQSVNLLRERSAAFAQPKIRIKKEKNHDKLNRVSPRAFLASWRFGPILLLSRADRVMQLERQVHSNEN
jgi:hypothetical protein